MSPVAFQRGIGKLAVEKSVVTKFGECDLGWREVERPVQDVKCIVFVEQADGQEVTDLQDERRYFLPESRLPFADLLIEKDDLPPGREAGPRECIYGETREICPKCIGPRTS
jgi:hypothetical protein